MPKITACVITKNEERVLERCLKSLSFADEIVIVDAFSTDRTAEIAKKYAQQFVQKEWSGFSAQRNHALSLAQGEWVFFLDSDEEVSPELARKLPEIVRASPQFNCYSIQRIEYFLGARLDYGPGNPSHQWRFFKRNAVKFVGEIHEYPEFEGSVGLVEEPIHHWPHLNIEKFLNKLNHYTTMEALDRFAQGQRTSLWHAFFTFFSTFLKNGISYRGFWNGKPGVILTLLESFSRVVRHLKLWVLWKVYEGELKMDLGFKLPEPGSKKAPPKEDFNKNEIRV